MHSQHEDAALRPALFLTYTCPVSRVTYAGHPSHGTLYRHTNDLPDAIHRIKTIARRHGQPVSWVINDQEYLNLEGLLPEILRFQSEGDSVLVTMELTTSPAEVDKTDTAAVIRWIGARCREAHLAPDGLWSLKFYESDLTAIASLPGAEYPWTRNLAGSCWHQLGIDESNWLGCPYNPYYPALWNSKAPAGSGDPHDFLMLEWLTRDMQACISGGFPATFSLDPADANRRDQGGFANEPDALRYSVRLIDETARQIAFNPTVVVNINEEARHYQTEGHDKDFMLDGMFRRFAEIRRDPPSGVDVKQAAYADVWAAWRGRHPETPAQVYVSRDLDWRQGEIPGAGDYNHRAPGDMSVLYQDASVQMAFLRSRGSLPVEFYRYADHCPGADSNDSYPTSRLPLLQLREQVISQPGGEGSGAVDVSLVIHSDEAVPDLGLMLWTAPVKGNERVLEKNSSVKSVRPTPAGLFVRCSLNAGSNRLSLSLVSAP